MPLHACGTDHQELPLEVARCEYLGLLCADLTLYAAGLDRPPSKAEVVDLWAHARQMRDDGQEAARWARQVLDLGWRPNVRTPSAVGGGGDV